MVLSVGWGGRWEGVVPPGAAGTTPPLVWTTALPARSGVCAVRARASQVLPSDAQGETCGRATQSRPKRCFTSGHHLPFLSCRVVAFAWWVASSPRVGRGAIVAGSTPRRPDFGAGSAAQRGERSLVAVPLDEVAGLRGLRLAGPVGGSAIRRPRSPRTRPAAGPRRRRAARGSVRSCQGRSPGGRRAKSGSRACHSPTCLRRRWSADPHRCW